MVNAVVVGSINMDVVLSVERFPQPGETLTGLELNHYPGGKGANQAVAIARMGTSVAMIAHVGSDGYGQQLLSGLNNNSVITTAVGKKEDVSSGLAFITVDSKGENNIVLIPGANHELSPDDVESNLNIISKAKAVVIQFEIPMETNRRALELAKQHDKLTIVNPAPALPPEDAKAAVEHADVLVVNETEAALLSGLPVNDTEEARHAGKKLLSSGPEAVIVTLGAEGAVLVTADQATHLPAPEVDVVDTTAAGDAFIGALTAALINGESMQDAVELANCAGALAVTKPGAQPSLPTMDDVITFRNGL